MTTSGVTRTMSPESQRLRARFTGVYYLLTIATGAFILFFHGKQALAVDVLVGIFYLVVTAFLYGQATSASESNRQKGSL